METGFHFLRGGLASVSLGGFTTLVTRGTGQGGFLSLRIHGVRPAIILSDPLVGGWKEAGVTVVWALPRYRCVKGLFI